MRASMIIPTLNEVESVGTVLRTFRATADEANRSIFRNDPIDWEMLVIDGASTDGTGAAAEAAGARVIVERRKGYGRAYRTGFAEATGEIIATSDGDGTYPVEEIPLLVRRLLDGKLDFITGDRLAFVTREAMTTEHRIGNRVLSTTLEIAYHRYVTGPVGTSIHDSQSGLWVFRRSILDRVSLAQDGMAMSEEIKIEALVRGFRVEEVPIRYGERVGPPKLSSWRDGLRNLFFLLRKRVELDRELRAAARRDTAP
jgi:glycosyltransferase involved in cell wall biosynthesis